MQLQSSLPVSRGNASLCRTPNARGGAAPGEGPQPAPAALCPAGPGGHTSLRAAVPARGARRSPQERASRAASGRTPGIARRVASGRRGRGRLAPAALQPGGRGARAPTPRARALRAQHLPGQPFLPPAAGTGEAHSRAPSTRLPGHPRHPRKCVRTHTHRILEPVLCQSAGTCSLPNGKREPAGPGAQPSRPRASEPTWSGSRTGRRRPSSPVGTRRAPSF